MLSPMDKESEVSCSEVIAERSRPDRLRVHRLVAAALSLPFVVTGLNTAPARGLGLLLVLSSFAVATWIDRRGGRWTLLAGLCMCFASLLIYLYGSAVLLFWVLLLGVRCLDDAIRGASKPAPDSDGARG